MAGDHCTEMPEQVGNPSVRLAFFASNPWRPFLNTPGPDQGHQDLDAACPRGLRPFHGAPVLGVGRGFFHFGLRGVAFPCGLALPLPSSRNGRGQGWDAQGEGLAGRLGVGLGLASIRPGTLPEPFL